jgi:hypothetical protein
MNEPTADTQDSLLELWQGGYSIPELWGYSAPVTRETSFVDAPHGLLWGTLSMVEYQVSQGAGHRYLRERLWQGDWVAIGFLAPRAADARLCQVPQFKDAKFGRKPSAVGDGNVKYVEVRIVHSEYRKFVDEAPTAPA